MDKSYYYLISSILSGLFALIAGRTFLGWSLVILAVVLLIIGARRVFKEEFPNE